MTIFDDNFDDNFWWQFLMTILDDNFWWQFLLTIFYYNFRWRFSMMIFDDNFWWQFLVAILMKIFVGNFLGTYFQPVTCDIWHWLEIQYWQLRTWFHDNLCYLTINCDPGQHLQFLRCFVCSARHPSWYRYAIASLW